MRENSFFALIGRMKFIGRWGLMKSTLPENVCEHSLMVAIIAHALAMIRREVFGGEIDPCKCAAAAIYHDAPEILTGDLPTPVKYLNPAIKNAYRQVEAEAAEKILSALPEELREAYRPLLLCERYDHEIYAIVKAADRISAYIKCVEELKSGNNEFKSAAHSILRSIEENPLPEARYFMERFIDSFSLTLDEL